MNIVSSFAASQVFQNRLFIGETLKRIQVLQKWGEIERMAEDSNIGVTQCAAKLDDFLESIKSAAEEVTRTNPPQR